jgi:hypothetical protein
MGVVHYADEDGDTAGLIFIHIPKTGGTSITHYLDEKYNLPSEEEFFNERLAIHPEEFTYMYHETWEEYAAHWDTFFGLDCNTQPVRARNLEKYKVFTVVRNPYTRAISDFFWWMNEFEELYRKGVKPFDEIPEQSTVSSMESFLETMIRSIPPYESSATCRSYDTHEWPQHYFLKGILCDGDSETQIQELQDVHQFTILKQENLTEDMRRCFHGLFQDFDVNDNCRQFKCHLSTKELITPRIISLVNEFYKRDFELFGYEMLDPTIDGNDTLPPDLVIRPRLVEEEPQ